MKMPIVSDCSVTSCAYNTDHTCHALAITVGDTVTPHCDTFCPTNTKGGDQQATAGVGACKVAECKHNVSLECQAPGIKVGTHGNSVECLTYQHV